MINSKSNNEILQELNQLVWGHLEAKKVLINLVNKSRIRYHQKTVMLEKDATKLIAPGKCLLVGGSGTGKTYLVQMLKQILNFPLLVLDATQLNPTGAEGGVKAENIKKMIVAEASKHQALHPDLYPTVTSAVDQMVVFIDEIDKLGQRISSDWNKHVQSNFLTVLENNHENYGISFIFAGAFVGMDKDAAVQDETAVNIGFNRTEKKLTTGASSIRDLDEAVVKYGLMPEIVGRINSIVALDNLGEDQYYDVLVTKLLPSYIFIASAYYNIPNYVIDEEKLRGMAQKALKSGQGVRSLKRQLDAHFTDLEFDNPFEYRSNVYHLAEKQIQLALGLDGE
jgi:ATP-dependent protease Clp ATPase subunit